MATTKTASSLRESIGAQSAEEVSSYLDLLVYGDAGVGKTYLCGTAADHEATRPVLLIDCEGGTTTIRHRPDVDVKRIRSLKELEELYEQLFFDTTGYYRTVALDSLTELQDVDMKAIMEAAYERKPDKVDKDVPSPREWGIGRNHIRKIVRAFRDLPTNFIMTALADEKKEEGEPTRYAPALPGKLQKEIPGFMNCVGYMQADPKGDEIVRTIQFQKTRRVVAKDRFDVLGPVLENPSVPLMIEKITG